MKRDITAALRILEALEQDDSEYGTDLKTLDNYLVKSRGEFTDVDTFHLELLERSGFVSIRRDAIEGSNSYLLNWAGYDLLDQLRGSH